MLVEVTTYMALFSKNKKSTPSSDNSEFDMFDIVGSSEENLSADQYPELSYDDMEDFNFPDDEEESKNKEKDSDSGSRFRRMFIAGTILALIIIAAVYFTQGDDSDSSSQGEDQNVSQQDDNNGDNGDNGENKEDSNEENNPNIKDSGVVATEQVGQEYSTSDDGNPINGTGAIMAFDYAYYVKRDGEAARKIFNPDADAYNAKYIQRAIDKVPQGTKHSLVITPVRIGEEYNVELTLNLPGAEEPTIYNQVFTTEEKDGQFYVKSFVSKTDE